jgi:hypothetical protein
MRTGFRLRPDGTIRLSLDHQPTLDESSEHNDTNNTLRVDGFPLVAPIVMSAAESSMNPVPIPPPLPSITAAGTFMAPVIPVPEPPKAGAPVNDDGWKIEMSFDQLMIFSAR